MNYKVGDKVKISKDLDSDFFKDPCINSEMAMLGGQAVTIKSIKSYGEQGYYYNVNENEWVWTDYMLEDKSLVDDTSNDYCGGAR